jgi:hypothetical protein
MFSILLFIVNVSFCQYKIAEGYLVQKIEKTFNPTYAPFFFPYHIASNGAYYIAKKKDVMEFIKQDSIDERKLTLLLEFNDYYFKIDTCLQNKIVKSYSSRYFKRLYDIITLDDAETYKIGNCEHYECAYVIRKMKYAYLDSIDMYAKEYELKYEYCRDDIQIPDDADTNTFTSAKDFYNVDYFQCFLFMIELQPTNKKILKHLWKRRYEFFEMSYEILK